MSSTNVGIFPASGGIGGGTVKHILNRLPTKNLTLIARSPAKLEKERLAGATVRKADYDDTSSLEHAFDGVETLFLISYASVEHQHRSERHRVAIDCALESGVKYIFYGSLGFAGSPDSQDTVAHVMKAHIDTEKYLEQIAQAGADFAFTVPRDVIKIPHDGSGPGIAWVKREELGEGTAELIRRFVDSPATFEYRNSRVLLSGQKPLTLSETVQNLSKIAQRPVKIEQVSDDEYAHQPQNPAGFTYKDVDYSLPWASSFEAFRRGEGSFVSPLLKELLGRDPEDFETTVASI